MNETIAIAAVRKSIRVKAPIDRADSYRVPISNYDSRLPIAS